MKISKLQSVLEILFEAKKSILLKGAPGIGKTDLIKKVCQALGYDLILTHPALGDPTDPKGFPFIVDGKAIFLPFGDLEKAINATRPTVWFLDDLGQAATMVQAAYMQLLHGGQCNEHKISDNVVMCAATNRREDMCGVTGIIEAVKGRFTTIIELTVDADDWVTWAYENDMPHVLIGCIHYRKAILHDFQPTANIVNTANPRTVAHVGELWNLGIRDHESIAGAAGEGFANVFCGFAKVWEDLPDLDTVETDPKNAGLPTEDSAMYAVATALAERVTKETFANIALKYMPRLHDEYHALFIHDALRQKPELQKAKGWTEWAEKHGHLLM